MPLEVGSVFAGYFLEEEVGRGGMGVVYRGRNVITERDEGRVYRFADALREAALCGTGSTGGARSD